MSQVLIQCPNPACKGRSVEGETVNRAAWEAHWYPPRVETNPRPGEWGASIMCPECGQEGIDPESGQLDSAEEELGRRCADCGVVSGEFKIGFAPGRAFPACLHCGGEFQGDSS